MSRRIHLTPALVLALGCAGSDLLTSQSVALGTPEAVGILRLVNAESTTFEILDDDVRLDRRAAANLVAHRNGPDGFYGTSDDALFQSLDEVDAIKWVGPSAMDKLLVYAEANAFVPGPEDILGSFDGVVFTVAEAERALQLCNEESESVLDDEIGLDRRAVVSIIEARPVETMHELAELYYVGGSALEDLKGYVAEPVERADCRFDGDCGSGWVCAGIPHDGSSQYGKCRPSTNVPGAGSQCSADDPCGPDLFCGGLTMWNTGLCVEWWQQDTFVNSTQRFIPDTTDDPVVTSVTVRGQATVPFDITVDVELAHEDPSALKIVLYDPQGTDAVLWDGPNEGGEFPGSFVALGNISRDDMVNGRWLLRVWNVEGNGVGNLHGWTLWLTSNFD